jgi:hypothetical protein
MPSIAPSTALPGQSRSGSDRLAKNLGYLSIALGVAELIAPRPICRAIGLNGLENVIRSYGVREVATGVAILASHDPTPWIWGRVAGDIADLATVATGLQNRHGNNTDRTLMALAGLAAVTAVDVLCASRLAAGKGSRTTALMDYNHRSGFPSGVQRTHGAARNVKIPEDMRPPRMLRPDWFADKRRRRPPTRAAG